MMRLSVHCLKSHIHRCKEIFTSLEESGRNDPHSSGTFSLQLHPSRKKHFHCEITYKHWVGNAGCPKPAYVVANLCWGYLHCKQLILHCCSRLPSWNKSDWFMAGGLFPLFSGRKTSQPTNELRRLSFSSKDFLDIGNRNSMGQTHWEMILWNLFNHDRYHNN